MSITANSVPAWYSKEEIECFEKIKTLAKKIPATKCIIVDPEESHVVIECRTKLSTDEILTIADFNGEGPEVPVSYAYERDRVEGKRYNL